MSLTIGPTGTPSPLVLSSLTPDVMASLAFGGGVAASGTYPTANLALFVPVVLSQPRTYRKAWWINGAAVAGNVDVGIYTLSGTTLTRVVASTAEAQATISVMQVATTFTTTTIGPGVYYLALSCTSTTSAFWRPTVNGPTLLRTAGVFAAQTSSPLPATATAAAMPAAVSALPLFGLSELSTI